MSFELLQEQVKQQKTCFIIVTGGVCSSLGKGILVSSIGTLLKHAGVSISVMKMDPYLNVDPGTMSPLEHGEVFVTHDGAETDLDLGHYERILDLRLSKESSLSSGQIFKELLEGERKGTFLGACIQLVPHAVNAIKSHALTFAIKEKSDFVLIEIGGTVGDIEGQVFLEAMRQLKLDLGTDRVMHAHLSYVPYLAWANEVKTKPTQHSVMALRKCGIMPDALFLRTERKVDVSVIRKVSKMCGVATDYIFQVPTYNPIYQLFLELNDQGVYDRIQSYFGYSFPKKADLSLWKSLISLIIKNKPPLTIGLVGKYIGSNDPYISVVEAIKSAAWACGRDPHVVTIEAEKITTNEGAELAALDGIVVPGGFDSRGVEGKIKAVRWAREQNIPYLGLCLGMQVMLIEFARDVLGLDQASSTEFNKKTACPVILLLEEQQQITCKGSSMRLGGYQCAVKANTVAFQAYGTSEVVERHRHRYEFNNAYKQLFEDAGIIFSGINNEKNLVEISELTGHRFMVGVQFHPEFLSSPLKPHPLFKAFISSTINRQIC